MPTSIFQEIEDLHTQCAAMDKTTRLVWLMEKRMRLNQLAGQLALHVRAVGGIMNAAERKCAHDLLTMIQEVDAKGANTVNELQNEALNGLRREVINELTRFLICN